MKKTNVNFLKKEKLLLEVAQENLRLAEFKKNQKIQEKIR